ncbi:KR domain-containing protein [Salipiger sp. IMCC34102]|uniref:type I polyketide synthase n=1 Tax=Salipiger sp. IMCC34102 TaxID=2510647 RepID=UPI00101C6487|nr:type I polyketide synthase [Salipiger sp. IMCC34102]RYH01248.1 KR domain-containing protein [Salipiger sp. IMCC34102]
MFDHDRQNDRVDTDIAIVGMAAHLPGAANVAEFWKNLTAGKSAIRELTAAELEAAGERPERLLDRNYVPFAAALDDFDHFDAEFFGFSPKEAAIMDPQHRQFLEVCWEALENAGRMPETHPGPIGVFAGCGMGSYFYFNLCSNPGLVDDVGMFLLRHTGNDKDFLATRVSHVFDLKGPSINLQTACSTSLVAVHYAVQSLLNGECDMALAGGVTIELPHRRGYIYEEGEILSPDGACHAFDHRAQGTVFGSGAGAVALRRLEDALADGDHIWGVVKGTAINNDGAAKAGYLAPSVEGQSRAIREAQAVAEVDAGSIGYVECHGTGTYLGDPIEVAALTDAFGLDPAARGTCRIGSVKTNIGHLDTAAGVASLIKATLSVHEGRIPPSLGYEKPNPAIDFDTSPFRVNDRLHDWQSERPRRAGVNSLGVGGTNAHAIVEEPPQVAASERGDWPFALLCLSGRNLKALDANAGRLAAHLRDRPDQALDDVAWTLKNGRRAFEKRRVIVAETHDEAAAKLERGDRREVFTHTALGDDPGVVFMFPGGGAQHVGMARDLYETEPVFQDWMDRGLDILQPQIDYDVRALWLAKGAEAARAAERLKTPSVQLPLIMIVEYALAKLWMSWGVEPEVLVGHSMGENTAACLAGVMSFEDCIGLVLLRGRLFDTVAPGGMLSVPLSADAVAPYLGGDLDIACVNAAELTVVSGPVAGLERARKALAADEIDAQRIAIDIAAHSRMLDPILPRFRDYLAGIDLHAPRIPIVSNRTGAVLTDAQAQDPDYWAGHLRGTVHFAECVTGLCEDPDRVLLEVGPGKALGSLAQANARVTPNQVINTLRHPDHDVADDAYFLATLGRLWATGVEIDWDQIWGTARRRRVPLPGYAFQRQRYFIEAGTPATATPPAPPLQRMEDIADWGWQPRWIKSVAPGAPDPAHDLPRARRDVWLMFCDTLGVADRAADRLAAAGERVIRLRTGDVFERTGPDSYTLPLDQGRAGYDQLVAGLVAEGIVPTRAAHFWTLTGAAPEGRDMGSFNATQDRGFYSLLYLGQAIAGEDLPGAVHVTVFTDGAASVAGEPLRAPAKATLAGPAQVLPKEREGLTIRLVDLDTPASAPARRRGKVAAADWTAGTEALDDAILEELLATPGNEIVALRGRARHTRTFRKTPLAPVADPRDLPLRRGGTYVVTGGFGGIGLNVAETLWHNCAANIVLVGRSPMPQRDDWDAHLRRAGPNDSVSRRIAAVRRLEGLGAQVLALSADVASLPEVMTVVRRTEERFGPINGVVHAAGAIDDAPFMTKSQSSVEAVFSPKIRGAQIIEECLPRADLDWLVLFSSTSTVTGPVGQVDYVAANEYLNAFAQSHAAGPMRVVSLNWGVWNEIGMAVEALADRTGARAPAPVEPLDLPLWDSRTFDDKGRSVLSATYDAGRDWILDGHRTRAGDALIPGTGYIEMIAQAMTAQGETGAFEIRDLIFLRPLSIEDGTPRPARLRLSRTIDGYLCDIQSGVRIDGREGFVTNARANLSLMPLDPPRRPDLEAVRAACDRVARAQDGGSLVSPQEAHLDFGPRWRVLQSTAFGDGIGIAELALPDAFRADLRDGWLAHPALLDLATGWAIELIPGYTAADLWVPVSYQSIHVHAALPARLVSLARIRDRAGAEGDFASFDILLTDPDGAVVMEVTNFTIHRMTDPAFTRPAAPGSRDVEFTATDATAPRALSPEEERMQDTIARGIRPEEGSEAFLRALAGGAPQIVVTSVDLDALVASAAANRATRDDGADKFDRPELDTEFVAPETDVQRMLVKMWEDLLGVNGVGIADSFFDLGGHSLIAVRLFSQIKKAYRVEFPISTLFEAPTIAACAALIEDRIGPAAAPAGDDGDTPPAASAAPARRSRHLVAMHDDACGHGTPFFLVAGMFGNVMNLRYLASLLQSDRPVYGLQARGLFRGDAPHESFAEAARDYIAEIRQVQPRGPYTLGGYSGGGLIAFEVAQQLTQAGETVSALVFLDTPLPVRPPLAARDKTAIKLQQMRESGPGFLARWARDRVVQRLTGRIDPAQAPRGGSVVENTQIEAAFHRSRFAYDLRPYDGPVTLFRPPVAARWTAADGTAIDEDRHYVAEDNFWRGHLPQIDVRITPGDHHSMVLEPNVRALALDLRAVLGRADRQAEDAAVWPHLQAAE